MSCDDIGELLMALVLITVFDSILIKSCFIDYKSVPIRMSTTVGETLVFEYLFQFAYKMLDTTTLLLFI